jgi:hypothetical protein
LECLLGVWTPARLSESGQLNMIQKAFSTVLLTSFTVGSEEENHEQKSDKSFSTELVDLTLNILLLSLTHTPPDQTTLGACHDHDKQSLLTLFCVFVI